MTRRVRAKAAARRALDHTPELEIVKQILKGSQECYFAIFIFAGSSGIDDALLATAGGGMKGDGVIDPDQAASNERPPSG
jgi:hypothetical protein